MSFTRFIVVVAVLACAGISTGAQADEILRFTLSGPDGSASWTQFSNPTPISSDAVETVIDVTSNGNDSNGQPVGPIMFFTSGYPVFGGLCTEDPCGGPNSPISEVGHQIFGGTTGAPVFLVGTYDFDYLKCAKSVSGTFCRLGEPNGEVLVVSAVPEPGTLVLFGAALLALGGLGIRKKFV